MTMKIPISVSNVLWMVASTSIVQHHGSEVRLGSWAVKLAMSICSPNYPR